MRGRPNIIFILSDDQGAWAMRCAGNADIHTPVLDGLSVRGTRFENFFCASPVCSPARASILTGTIPSAHGVQDWLRGGNVNAGRPDIQGHPEYAHEHEAIQYLQNFTTYTDLLAQAGYTCALSGKWHLGDSVTPQHGFSHWYTIGRGGCNYYRPDMVRDGKIAFEQRYVTDLITEDAIEQVRSLSKGDAPFYLSVHYTAPHSPWDREEHPARFWDMYEDCAFAATPDLPVHPWQVHSAPYGEGEERKALLRGYYAAISAMDEGIGRILETLEECGAAEDTYIFFTADNGMNMGHHGIWGKGNGTFPLNLFDTSVKVPFIACGPGIPKGRVARDMCGHMDILPTFQELFALEGEAGRDLPGRSFAPALEGRAMEQGAVVVCDEYGPVRMLRDARYKYIHRYPYGPHEFYDLAEDENEEHNLYGDARHAARIAQMREALLAWFDRYVDPAIDGARQAASGSGQLRRPDIFSGGQDAFAPVPQRVDGSDAFKI